MGCPTISKYPGVQGFWEIYCITQKFSFIIPILFVAKKFFKFNIFAGLVETYSNAVRSTSTALTLDTALL
jgi:hypothetical protein